MAGPAMAVTLTAYAARRGVSVKSVSRAAAAGRLAESVRRDERGRAVEILDPELADREWAANTRQRADRPAVEDHGDLTAAQRIAPRPSARLPLIRPDDQPIAAPPPREGPAVPPRARRADLPEGVPVYHVSQAIRAQAAARREVAAADTAELELAALRGRLVDADAANAKFRAHISMAKTRLLTVATLVAQDAPDLAVRIVPLIERRIREALEELAIDGRRA